MACKRTVVWHGKTEDIEVEEHSYAWSGAIPCTGMWRCIYCGKPEADTFNGRPDYRPMGPAIPVVPDTDY